MQSQAKAKQRQDARRAGRKADKTSPLRRIVDYQHTDVLDDAGEHLFTRVREVLECGHLHRSRDTWHGGEGAKRRRCKKCAVQSHPLREEDRWTGGKQKKKQSRTK
jgi:hypothetical protein